MQGPAGEPEEEPAAPPLRAVRVQAPIAWRHPEPKPHPPLDMEGAGLGPCPADTVQQLFEAALGGPRPLPEELRASSGSQGTASREREEMRFKVAAGRSLDYQAVPWAGTLLGVTHHPERRPAHRKPDAAPPAATPAHAVLWALVQPSARLGVNSSLSAVDAGPTGFGSWHQDAFLDLSERVGLDYELSRHPASGLSGELSLTATAPKLPLLPALTARHRVAASQAVGALRHASQLSLPLLGGAAVAKAELAEAAPGSDAAVAGPSVLRLELQGSGRRSRGLAGGIKLKPDLADKFRTADPASVSNSGSSSGSDSEDEACGTCSTAGGSHDVRQRRTGRSRVPHLKVEVAPRSVRGWEDVSGRWQQAWGGRLNSSVAYQSRQRRWSFSLSQRLTGWLTAAGSLVCDAPGELAAAAAAEGGEIEAAASSSSIGSSMGAAQPPGRLHQLASHIRSYAAAAHVRKAGLKLTCRLRQPARQLRLESCYDAGEGGLAHAVAYRLGRGAADWQQQAAWCDLALQARPHTRHLLLKLDFFAPL